jgi:hypothetical protein
MDCIQVALDVDIAGWRKGPMSSLKILDRPRELTAADLRDSPIDVREGTRKIETMPPRKIL